MSIYCALCGKEVDPLDRGTYHRIVGWERKALASSRKSGSDIALREARDEYAHGVCVRLRQDGIAIGQETIA